jgi:drug/metabolite transporter (DMT)-like permease
MVAALLGWLIYREPFGAKEITAMAIIFAGVGVVKRFSQKPAAAEEH